MKTITQLYQEFEALSESDRPYELFEVSDILFNVRDLKNSIERRKGDIDDLLASGKDKNEDGFTEASLREWLSETESVLAKCKPILDFLGNNQDGLILVRRVERSKEDEELWVAHDSLENWFMQEPVGFFRDAQDADRAEAFYNGVAMIEASNKGVQ